MATSTPATVAALRAGVAFQLHEYPHDVAQPYGLAAVERLGLDPARVFKTLVVASPERSFLVAVVPVAGSLNLRALGAAVGMKRLEMADAPDAERVTGYVLGGISPIGQRKRLPTVVDESANGFDTVYVSGR
jgi:Cys-tRNA(Pro)/Cys-tRNA(Cys) deacylase